MAKNCKRAGAKRSIRVKIGRRSFTAHKCSPKTKAQKALARAARACAGVGKVGTKTRGACIRKHF
jgi:hypothetical protein